MREGGREGIILRLNSTSPFVSHQSTEVHEIEFCFKQTVFFYTVSLPPPPSSPHLMGWEQAAQTPCLSVSLAATDGVICC